jgi:hypothetical protein
MSFFTYCEVENGVFICEKYIFVLVEIKALQEGAETHFIVRIGLETLTSAVLSWV